MLAVYLVSAILNRDGFGEVIPVRWLQSKIKIEKPFNMRSAYFSRSNTECSFSHHYKTTKSKIYSLVVANDFISSFPFDAIGFGLNGQHYTKYTCREPVRDRDGKRKRTILYIYRFHIIHIDYVCGAVNEANRFDCDSEMSSCSGFYVIDSLKHVSSLTL